MFVLQLGAISQGLPLMSLYFKGDVLIRVEHYTTTCTFLWAQSVRGIGSQGT